MRSERESFDALQDTISVAPGIRTVSEFLIVRR